MYDYITIVKYMGKDSPILDNCQRNARHKCYELKSCNGHSLFVDWNEKNRELTINGSFPYFWRGHNFTYNLEDLVATIGNVQELLCCDLMNARVTRFEFGVIVEVEKKAMDYILNHKPRRKPIGENRKGACMIWNLGAVDLKMYDEGRNIRNKQKTREGIYNAIRSGWNPQRNYVKFEVRFKNPKLLKHGEYVLLKDLFNEAFFNHIKEVVLSQYQLLAPTKGVSSATNKKALTTADILARTFIEATISEQNKTKEDAKKSVYRNINNYPDSVLSKADKDYRKRKVRETFKKIDEVPESEWNLDAKIRNALGKDK